MDSSRRSHVSLKHLSLSPLTPSYPLPPTSPPPPLQTSTSYSYIASPTYPSTPRVLSPSSSRTRLRSGQPGPLPIMTSTSSPSFPKPSRRPAHYSRATTNAIPTSASLTTSAIPSPPPRIDEESSWLLRTASTLQSQRMEEKGQAWLATRNSSTSLTNTGADDMADDEFSPYQSTYSQPQSPAAARSRTQSRYASRVPSRLGSRMQSRAGSDADLTQDALRALARAKYDELRGAREGEMEIMGPDFVDPAVFEDEDGLEEEVDEGEMKRVIMGRAKGWVDWAVGWMDLRGEEEMWDGSDDEKEGGFKLKGDLDERKRRMRRKPGQEAEGDKVVSEPPPQDQDAGVLADAKWLLGLATKLVV